MRNFVYCSARGTIPVFPRTPANLNSRAHHIGNGGLASRVRSPEIAQLSGSTLTIEPWWLLPTQNVTGVVELSTNTRRMLVSRGSRYSTNLPVVGSSLETRSLSIEPVQTLPVLSIVTS